MPNGSAESPYVIDPSFKLAWPLAFNVGCDSDCEMAAFMKDVTPQLLALEPGDCFVFAPRPTKIYLRIERYGHPFITAYPLDAKKRVVPLEEAEGRPVMQSQWRKFLKNFDWDDDVDQF